MTANDLRLNYQKDTGLKPAVKLESILGNIDLKTLEKLERLIKVSNKVELETIPYINWLEERLKQFENEKKA